ncbi:S8 family peptidase [Calothrix sp. 336/3]|uniref:S8 family peptidase n=1 Tax=Calothrix sp. 336/3 TaxID=1337936 RepID=UPI0004E46047|nr:S8 family serine peptidase [Calothrix sp. 336/3]AKG20680.1 peptidase S8/S53 subtilisin kexin sedolisin [Calothrix sp. 336/3]
MNRQLAVSSILLASTMLAVTSIFPLTAINRQFKSTAAAQTPESQNNQLFYLYQGKPVPLTQQKDAIAVEFKPVSNARNRGANPLYLQLEQDLAKGAGTRGGSQIQVKPLGGNYAVVALPAVNADAIRQKIKNQSYVKTSLPVLSRASSQDTIILPNEIIVSFQPNMGEKERASILKQNNLEIIRPLRFLPNIYIVKSTTVTDTAVLNVANQLNQVKGITSAAPNFLQSVADSVDITQQKSQGLNLDSGEKQSANATQRGNKSSSTYLGLQWHLNSAPLQTCLQQKINNFAELQSCLQEQSVKEKQTKPPVTLPRTDLRVTEAWQNSNGGKGVVVAVVDSLIQWNHPDLQNNLYKVSAADKCPGEEYGWDFSEPSNSKNPCEIGDADTKMSPLEMNILRKKLQDTFKLSDGELIKRYLSPQQIAKINPQLSQKQIGDRLRTMLRSQVGGEFHGTLVSGVIAAKPQTSEGMWGVAPNAKILPVRVFGLNGSIQNGAVLEAVAYSANRGADVINLSLGKMIPTDVEDMTYKQILQQNPKLVIVASSGNSNYPRVGFPSGYEGVLSVGATNLFGDRAPYSNYGMGLGVVAPGGDLSTSVGLLGGIATTGGTWMESFWQGLAYPNFRWSEVVDARGKYWWMQGTSFSSPAVAGVVALMKGEDGDRRLNRQQIINILKSTASYDSLRVSQKEKEKYRSLVNEGLISSGMTEQQVFFGSGLINADAAVRAVKK